MYEQKTLKSNSSNNPLSSFIKKFNECAFAKAFCLCAFSFLIRLIFLDFKYEVSDDYMVDAVLSGAFGNGYDPHLLFSNVILGYFLKFFYELIPQISFYFVFLELMGFLSLLAVTYIVFSRNKGIVGWVFSILILSAFANDLFVLIQFTKVATVSGIAGGLLVLHGIWNDTKHKIRFIVMGSIITIFGALLRFETIYFFAAFLVLAFLYHAISVVLLKKAETKEKIMSILWRLLICVALVGILYGLSFVGGIIYRTDAEHAKYADFQPVRYGITDTNVPDYEPLQSAYAERGLDETDFFMLNSWSFTDRSVYPDDLVRDIGTIQRTACGEESQSMGYVLNMFVLRGIMFYWPSICLYVTVLLALLMGKKKLFPLLILLVNFGLIFALIYMGRTMYRVECGILFCSVATVITCFEKDEKSALTAVKRKIIGEERSVIELFALVLAVGLVLIRVPFSLPNGNYKSLSDEEYAQVFDDTLSCSGEYLQSKYTFMVNHRRPSGNLVDLMESDNDHYYYVDFFTGIQSLYFNYKPWIRPSEGLFTDYGYYGSVALHFPGEIDALEKNGIDPMNPLLCMVNDNVYVVDRYYCTVKLNYLRKYLDPSVEVELIDTVDGYPIYNFYIPEKQ